MSKDDIIERLIMRRENDYFGLGSLRKSDRLQWLQVRRADMRRLKEKSYGELENLYYLSEGLCDEAE